MTIAKDIKSTTENVIEQVVTRVPDLPRPVAAVVGAGDKAADQITALSSDVTEKFEQRRAKVTKTVDPAELSGKVTGFVTELPAKAQGFVDRTPGQGAEGGHRAPGQGAEGGHRAPGQGPEGGHRAPGQGQQTGLATDLPGKAQKLATDLSGKAQKIVTDLTGKDHRDRRRCRPERAGDRLECAGQGQQAGRGPARRRRRNWPATSSRKPCTQTAEVYAGIVGSAYAELADHGQKVWDRMREAASPKAGKTVNATTAKPRTPARKAATKPAAAGQAGCRQARCQAGNRPPRPATKTAAAKPAARKATAAEPAARKAPAKAGPPHHRRQGCGVEGRSPKDAAFKVVTAKVVAPETPDAETTTVTEVVPTTTTASDLAPLTAGRAERRGDRTQPGAVPSSVVPAARSLCSWMSSARSSG